MDRVIWCLLLDPSMRALGIGRLSLSKPTRNAGRYLQEATADDDGVAAKLGSCRTLRCD